MRRPAAWAARLLTPMLVAMAVTGVTAFRCHADPKPGAGPGNAGSPSSPAAAAQGASGAHVGIPPSPANSGDDNDVVVKNADHLYVDKDEVVTATGNVRIKFQGYEMTSDSAVVDVKADTATFTGNVRVKSSNSSTSARADGAGGMVILDLGRHTYHVFGGETAILAPEQAPSMGLISPLYISGGDVDAEPGVVDARDGAITTCGFPDPHYLLLAHSITVVPGKRLVLRHVTYYRRGRRLFTVPLLVFPLNNRYDRQSYLPTIGDDPYEGYFIKFGVPYALTSTALGLLTLEYMQLRGTDVGIEQHFDTDKHNDDTGTVQVDYLADKQTGLTDLTGTWNEKATLFNNVHLNLASQFESNSYYNSLGASLAEHVNLDLARNVGGVSTSLDTSVQQSNFGLGGSTTYSSTYTQAQNLSKTSSINVKLSFNGSSSPGVLGVSGTSTDSVNTDWDLGTHRSNYSLDLYVDSFTSLKTAEGSGEFASFGNLERLPEVKFSTTPYLFHKKMKLMGLLPKPTTFTVLAGEYHEPISQIRTERLDFNLNLGTLSDIHHALDTTYGGSFEQAFYGDGAAKYVLDGLYGETYQFTKLSSIQAQYNYVRAYGFTPFFFDLTNATNAATLNLDYKPNHRLTLTSGTGYNFNEASLEPGFPATPWQTLFSQLQWNPTNAYMTRLTGTYDPNNGKLFDLSDDFSVKFEKQFILQTSTMYVPQSGTISELNESLDWTISTDRAEDCSYRLRAISGYDGYTKTFGYEGLAVTRSWHDFALTGVYQTDLQGLTQGDSFYLDFRLRAFPGYEPFGVGQFGQGLDTGLGQIF